MQPSTGPYYEGFNDFVMQWCNFVPEKERPLHPLLKDNAVVIELNNTIEVVNEWFNVADSVVGLSNFNASLPEKTKNLVSFLNELLKSGDQEKVNLFYEGIVEVFDNHINDFNLLEMRVGMNSKMSKGQITGLYESFHELILTIEAMSGKSSEESPFNELIKVFYLEKISQIVFEVGRHFFNFGDESIRQIRSIDKNIIKHVRETKISD